MLRTFCGRGFRELFLEITPRQQVETAKDGLKVPSPGIIPCPSSTLI
jgi:hypothetical protein